MKLAGIVFLLSVSTAFADCQENIQEWVSSDKMVNTVEYNEDRTVFWINNIRNFKAIDISFYGFDNNLKSHLELDKGCVNVEFREFYNEYGIPVN